MNENLGQPNDDSAKEMILAAVTSQSLTDEQCQLLEELLQTDEDFRKAYLECIEMDAMLKFRLGASDEFKPSPMFAGNNQPVSIHPTTNTRKNSKTVGPKTNHRIKSRRQTVTTLLTIAAIAASIFAIVFVPNQPHKPTVVESFNEQEIRLADWTIRSTKGSIYEIVNEKQINLLQGGLHVESTRQNKSQALTISTATGSIIARDSRFYVNTAVPTGEATTLKTKLITKLLVLSGICEMKNSLGTVEANPGEFVTAEHGKAPVSLQDEGNYREAYDIYYKLIVDANHTGEACATDLARARDCLHRLGRFQEWDELIEKVIDTHPEDWQVLYEAALQYSHAPHHGVLIANQFRRGANGGQPVNTTERDRVRAIQLMQIAMPLAPPEGGRRVADFYSNLAGMIQGGRQLWNLQTLTNTERLPEIGEPVYWSHNSAPPVDENNQPIFYALPNSWDSAVNDGERWRWLLEARGKADATQTVNSQFEFANFLHGQFGVHTSGAIGWPQLEDGQVREQGRYTTHTLKTNETIARLATGVSRFELPADQNFIALYEQISELPLDDPPSPLSELSYKVYHGDWNKLPAFSKLDPVKSGEVSSQLFELDVADRTDHYGIVFQGVLNVPEDGEFEFALTSDDGTRLSIDNELVIDHDGCHGMDQRDAKVKLSRGEHSIRLEFFQKDGGEGLILTWKGPSFESQYLSRQHHEMRPQERALEKLAYIFENRRQLERAADYWQKCIDQFGMGHKRWRREHRKQIVGNWLRFESAPVFAAGQKAKLAFQFRNATSVRFKAHQIDIEKYLAYVKTYLKSDPRRLDAHYQLSQLGHLIVVEGYDEYIKNESIEWTQTLDPPSGHWTRRSSTETPLDKTGVYLVEATAENGNTSRVLCWITDTTIVMKRTDKSHLYFVADSITGKPVEKANIEVFAHWTRWDEEVRRHYTKTVNFAKFTDENGLAYTDASDVDDKHYSRIVIARDKETGRFGVLGDFFHEPLRAIEDSSYQHVKAWCTTDRPVYRPGQQVYFKSWVRLAQYDLDHISAYAGKEFTVHVFDPSNNEVFNKKIRSDEFGGLAFDWELEDEVMLGSYHFDVIAHNFKQPSSGELHKQLVLGSAYFRVEEYKKPEYEVTVDAPTEAVALGDRFSATVRANYYFGSPVTNAQVKYTVRRTNTVDSWFPQNRWDWLYGSGYWWWGYDYYWYPGWDSWCLRRVGWFQSNPPEVLLENTVPIGEDGTVKVEIDTSAAKEIFDDSDHRYSITAEVVDESRRTVTGEGSVTAARHPYNVYVWMRNGHYRVGDPMEVSIQARTANGNNVSAEGELSLYRIVFDKDGKPNESLVDSWKVKTDDTGQANLTLKADKPGQYRVACQLTNAQGHSRVGAALTRIVGDDATVAGDGFRFDDLELILDKAEYQPGERAKLLINTAQANSTVALFIRPVNGVYPRPRIIQLTGKSTMHEIDIARSDMPNIHVEAFTVSDGRFYQVAKQIVVPPEKRVLTLTVEPSQEEYNPGEKAKVKLQLTDSDGKPFVGSTVVAIYDKSLEAIAESQVADIRGLFWKWHRGHSSAARVSLQRSFSQLLRRTEIGMGDIGTHWINRWDVYGRGRFRSWGEGSFDHFFADVTTEFRSLSDNLEGLSRLGTFKQTKNPSRSGLGLTNTLQFHGEDEQTPQPQIRSRFADTALWVSSVTTNQDGIAEVELEMPENLTTWKIRAWSMGHGTRVGHGVAEVITNKDVIVRLQAPRFFTESDEVTLSANVHNYTSQALDFQVALENVGDHLQFVDNSSATKSVRIEPDADQRVEWRVRAVNEGNTVVRVKAIAANGASDAMEQMYPVYVHGMLKTDSYSVAIRGDEESKTIEISVPEERRANQTHLEIRYSPSIALALVDALPYLATNPYENSEAAMSRFGPLVTTRHVLTEMGIDLDTVREKQVNLNAQEIGEAQNRATDWKRGLDDNPVYNSALIDKLVERCLRDLTSMQNSDGGWGWYAGHRSDAHSTAYVVQGLQTAQTNGAAIVPGVIEKGLHWLESHQNHELKKLKNAKGKYRPWKTSASNADAFVFLVLVEAGRKSDEMSAMLYRDRLKLSHYCQAMLGLALDKLGKNEERDMVIRNLSQFLEQDAENQTAWLRLNRGYRWYWYGNDIETNACYLKLLCRTGQANSDVASGLAKYLLNNRKHAAYWNASRDTAIAIDALAEYVLTSGEADPDMSVSVLLDGKLFKEVKITKENLFSYESVIHVEAENLSDGQHTVEIRREGKGNLYANAYLTNFTLEDFISHSGLEIKVKRRYYKLSKLNSTINAAGSRGNVVDYRIDKMKRTLLQNGDTVKSGDLIEVELILESKNDYEYLQFSDRKPAGCEAITTQSGHRWLGGVSAYMQLRDERVDLFVHRLRQGQHSLTYRLRAEVPGKFSALPTTATGVYAPELKANSDSAKLIIE